MSFPFDAQNGPIIVEASLSGPLGQADLRHPTANRSMGTDGA
jgi:hypothetical protein